jgi:hypothetical protein
MCNKGKGMKLRPKDKTAQEHRTTGLQKLIALLFGLTPHFPFTALRENVF